MLKCQICQSDIDCFVSAYSTQPFIDGRKYDTICLCCSEVPKTYDIDHRRNKLIFYSDLHTSRLNSVDYLVSEGFTTAEAKTSISAVKKCLKSRGKAKLITNKVILQKLFIPIEFGQP